MMPRQICLARSGTGGRICFFICQVGVIYSHCFSHLTATGHLDNPIIRIIDISSKSIALHHHAKKIHQGIKCLVLRTV